MEYPLWCATSSEINQVSGILPLIEKYEISDKIFHVNIDITARNTGKWVGSATILQKHIHSAYVWIIRRHHIVEKLVRHGLDAIRGATTSPFEIEHNQFQKNWSSLCQKIDYANLSKFEWKAVLGTTMEAHAQEALSFCNHTLKTSTFAGGDNKKLSELEVVYLGGLVESFKFKRPGASHHARFMAKAIYST